MSAKTEILDSAIELFAAKGFDGVSIREIAERADVHFSSVRYYFGDKEELYKECISQHGEGRLKIASKYLDHVPESAEDLKLRLTFVLDETLQAHSENPYLSKLVLQEIETSKGKNDQVLRKTMIAMTELFAKFLKKGQAAGFIRSDLEPEFLTQALMGTLHHFMRTEGIRERIRSQPPLKNKEFREELVKKILKLYIY